MSNVLRASKLAKKLNVSTDELSDAFGVKISPNQKIYTHADTSSINNSSRLIEDTVVAVDDQVYITEDYTVLACGVPAGSLVGNLVWFSQTLKPQPSSIKQIVFLGDYSWGYKQLSSKLEEFNNLSSELQCEILENIS